jgi:prevent-host-death family protein
MRSEHSVPVTIPATKVHRQFGEVVRRVYSSHEHFIVEKDGLPVAVIISMAEYEAFIKERDRREQRLEEFEKFARELGAEAERQGLTEEQLAEELDKDKEATYKEVYGDSAG